MTENFFDEQSEQSQIKAAIVADYFWRWANVIISTQNRYPQHPQRIAYIDLFAGPGRYQNGSASTPLLIMQRAVADAKIRERLVAVFNDKDENNSALLRRKLPQSRESIRFNTSHKFGPVKLARTSSKSFEVKLVRRSSLWIRSGTRGYHFS